MSSSEPCWATSLKQHRSETERTKEKKGATGSIKRMWAKERNGCDNNTTKDFKREQAIDGNKVIKCVCIHYKSVLIVLASYQVASNPCAIWRGNYKVDPGACRKKPF